ncbi:MAG TPA: hypothetical protein VH020_01955 [Stellaceae bacterium]|jgi:hypothetical protein|nr:hypothetical protein [Stellaceae bacterium]
MRTNEFGREIVPERRSESAFYRGIRVYLSGVGIGVGLCLGLGPPLPLINLTADAVASEQAPDGLLSGQWPSLRDVPFNPDTAVAAISVSGEAIDLLLQKWQVLIHTLHKIEGQQIAEQ